MTTQPFPGPWDKILPSFGEMTNKVLFGDIWERPGLSKRDRVKCIHIQVAPLSVLILRLGTRWQGPRRRTNQEVTDAILRDSVG